MQSSQWPRSICRSRCPRDEHERRGLSGPWRRDVTRSVLSRQPSRPGAIRRPRKSPHRPLPRAPYRAGTAFPAVPWFLHHRQMSRRLRPPSLSVRQRDSGARKCSPRVLPSCPRCRGHRPCCRPRRPSATRSIHSWYTAETCQGDR